MQVKREFIIVPENFKALTKGQQRRKIDKGFVHALQRQICLEKKKKKKKAQCDNKL